MCVCGAGVVTTTPLFVELSFEPVETEIQWFIVFTYVYRNKITFPGSRTRQEIGIETLK